MGNLFRNMHPSITVYFCSLFHSSFHHYTIVTCYYIAVMWLLRNLLNTDLPPKVTEQALKSVGSWSEFGFHPDHMEPMFELVFHTLRQKDEYGMPRSETFDAAVDTIVKVVTHPDIHKYDDLREKKFSLGLFVWSFA